jgi:hypothetical protein
MPIGLQVPTLHAGVHAVALTITLHQRFGQPLGLGFIGSTPHEQRRAPVEQLYLAGVPRAAVLALFWETQWGRGHIYADQVNEIRLLYAQLNLMQKQYRRATQIITGLRALHASSANEPLFEELTNWPLQRTPTFGTTEESENFAERVREAIRMTEQADTRAVVSAH